MKQILNNAPFLIFAIIYSAFLIFEAVKVNKFSRNIRRVKVMYKTDIKRILFSLLKLNLLLGVLVGIFVAFSLYDRGETGYVLFVLPLMCLIGVPMISLTLFSFRLIPLRKFYEESS